jgi:uncharacterized zinc-type alcohol dehydrogenase-like protein
MTDVTERGLDLFAEMMGEENATPACSIQYRQFIHMRRNLAGSMIGGIAETQEMLDVCAKHGIVADIEMIKIDEIDAAYDRMQRGEVKYRVVIDNATL